VQGFPSSTTPGQGPLHVTVTLNRLPNALTAGPGRRKSGSVGLPLPPSTVSDLAHGPLASPPPGEITQLLHAAGRGEARASAELLPLIYQDLRRHAAVQMAREAAGQTLQPTALLHEAWLRVDGGQHRQWQNRAHFFGAAAEAMRRILIENARRKSRLKRGGDLVRVDADEVELAATSPDEKVLLINDALESLQAQDPEKARVVLLKFFGGRTNQEVAEALAVTERTVERHWAYAKAWLFQHIRTQR
jgi:RNA polymerase sigma factor (TIGR02999 family)